MLLEAKLFDGAGSSSAVKTWALKARVGPTGGLARILALTGTVIVTCAPAATVSRMQVIVPVPTQLPWVVVIEPLTVRLLGNVPVTVAEAAPLWVGTAVSDQQRVRERLSFADRAARGCG